ncbi:MAG: OmpA family protein [Candidatus Kapabacteria bacterium]|nr:OmpA family protein [Candidatus Kapabacteria bacterium]
MSVYPLCAQDVFTSNVRIINPGEPLNHKGLDYAPAISPDGKTLYYVSNRPGSKRNPSGGFSHDFWSITKPDRLSTVFYQPVNMDTILLKADNGLNTSRNEGVPSIAANRRMMFFTGCDRPDVLRRKKPINGVRIENDACDIYVVELNEHGEWGIPRNLGPAVNSDSWDGHPSISPDGRRLYFASDRPGGLGDVDIWYSDYDPVRRQWLPAKNAGAVINTPYREWSPFIAANNRELFFASEGHRPNYGGTDFYVAVRNEKDEWSRPRNLGQPINTSSNEAFICTPASRDVLYFASQRTDIPNAQGNYDIFMAFVPKSSLSVAIPLVVRALDGCTLLNTAATISITNPITKRIIVDTLNGLQRVALETVVTDFDFGPLSNPADTLYITVTAYSPQYGAISRVVGIPHPTKNSSGTYDAMPEIEPIVLAFGERPVLSSMLQVLHPSAMRPLLAQAVSSEFRGLVMEEIVSISVNRILNYIFFDEGQSVIPSRYKMFKTSQEAEHFDEERLRGETLDKYYHVLNVFGSRLRKFPKSMITIVGCNDATSPNEKRAGLSRARANAVLSYLRDIWKISEKRMKIVVRSLPAVPSNREDSLGLVENRRVEILCDDWDIIKPVVDKTPTIAMSAPIVHFTLMSPESLEHVPAPVHMPPQPKAVTVGGKTLYHMPSAPLTPGTVRTLTIFQGSKVWKRFDNLTTQATIIWNWKNDSNELPLGDIPLKAVFSVKDKSGRECYSEAITIPIRRITSQDKQQQRVIDKTLERYHLIMFPFDKSDIGATNSRILKEYVVPRLFPDSEVLVVGHTDIIGSEEYNLRLSAARGARAKEELAALVQNSSYKSLESKGVGEAEPLFDNALPEGRFYNRTVQVIIETPLKQPADEQ